MPPPCRRPRPTFKPNAETLQKKEAQADRADTSMEQLSWDLLEFLTYVLQEAWDCYGAGPGEATEEAQSSGHATEQAQSMPFLEEIVFDKISEWSSRRHPSNHYDEPALLLNCLLYTSPSPRDS